jgi:hypothetical protein
MGDSWLHVLAVAEVFVVPVVVFLLQHRVLAKLDAFVSGLSK